MIAFDTLAELEAYAQVFPEVSIIITVMDRSLPYEAEPGRYDTPEKSDVRYIVDEFLTSDKGFASHDCGEKRVMEIVLDGEEVVSVDGSAFHLAEGRFLIYPADSQIKRGVAYALPSYCKAVRFLF